MSLLPVGSTFPIELVPISVPAYFENRTFGEAYRFSSSAKARSVRTRPLWSLPRPARFSSHKDDAACASLGRSKYSRGRRPAVRFVPVRT